MEHINRGNFDISSVVKNGINNAKTVAKKVANKTKAVANATFNGLKKVGTITESGVVSAKESVGNGLSNVGSLLSETSEERLMKKNKCDYEKGIKRDKAEIARISEDVTFGIADLLLNGATEKDISKIIEGAASLVEGPEIKTEEQQS
ncbi:MAG: hypothetical protein KAI88_06320 [Nitrosomonadaceae bacterium]|nr:hypothetical protein [Nitrosomonadaceae bacterium]